MSKRDYLDQLAHLALYEEYTKPGVGCHMVLKQLLYERGWADPDTHRMNDVGRRYMSHLINRYQATGQPIPGVDMEAEYPNERPPERRSYPNEDMGLAFGCGAVIALFILILVITFYP